MDNEDEDANLKQPSSDSNHQDWCFLLLQGLPTTKIEKMEEGWFRGRITLSNCFAEVFIIGVVILQATKPVCYQYFCLFKVLFFFFTFYRVQLKVQAVFVDPLILRLLVMYAYTFLVDLFKVMFCFYGFYHGKITMKNTTMWGTVFSKITRVPAPCFPEELWG